MAVHARTRTAFPNCAADCPPAPSGCQSTPPQVCLADAVRKTPDGAAPFPLYARRKPVSATAAAMHALRATQIADCAFQFLRGTFPLAYAAQMRSVFECNALRSFFHERKERPMGKKRKLAGAYEVVFKDSHPHLKRPLSFTRTRSGPGLKTRCWRKPHFLPRARSGCSHRPCYNHVATFLPLPRARGVVRQIPAICPQSHLSSARARSGCSHRPCYNHVATFLPLPRARGVVRQIPAICPQSHLSSARARSGFILHPPQIMIVIRFRAREEWFLEYRLQ